MTPRGAMWRHKYNLMISAVYSVLNFSIFFKEFNITKLYFYETINGDFKYFIKNRDTRKIV